MWVKFETYLKVPDNMDFGDRFYWELVRAFTNAGVQQVDSPSVRKI